MEEISKRLDLIERKIDMLLEKQNSVCRHIGWIESLSNVLIPPISRFFMLNVRGTRRARVPCDVRDDGV